MGPKVVSICTVTTAEAMGSRDGAALAAVKDGRDDRRRSGDVALAGVPASCLTLDGKRAVGRGGVRFSTGA